MTLSDLLSRTVRRHATGCLLWKGWTSEKGYALCRYQGRKKVRVIRLVHKLLTGRWPRRDREMLHSCDDTQCINPEHLKQGTRRKNAQERQARGRTRGARTYKAATMTGVEVEF